VTAGGSFVDDVEDQIGADDDDSEFDRLVEVAQRRCRRYSQHINAARVYRHDFAGIFRGDQVAQHCAAGAGCAFAGADNGDTGRLQKGAAIARFTHNRRSSLVRQKI
jgi:hypothetical protein